MPLTEQERQKLAALRSMSSGQPQGAGELRRESFLSRPMARFASGALGAGGGAALGAQLGAAAGAVFPPAVPFTTGAGAILGAGAGTIAANQARRAAAARLEYDRPEARGQAMMRSLGLAPEDFLQGSLTQAGGMALRPAMRAAAPYVGRGYTRLREFMTGVEPGTSARVLERGAGIVKPEYREGVPRAVSAKVQRGVNAFMEKIKTQYHNVTPKIKAQLGATYLDITPRVQAFQQALVEVGLIEPTGRPLTGLLGRGLARESAKESALLRGILARLTQVASRTRPGRFGGTRGFVRADEIHRTIKQLDDFVSYSRRGVNPIGDQGEMLVKQLRRGLMDDLGEQVPALSKRNSLYAQGVDLYEDVQKKVTNESVAGTVKALASRSNEFPFPELKTINDKLPRAFRFMDDVQDYLAGREFVKAPGLSRAGFQLALPGIGVGGAMLGHPLATAAGVGSAAVAMSPSLYARELGAYRLMSPYAQLLSRYLGRGTAPALSGAAGAYREE